MNGDAALTPAAQAGAGEFRAAVIELVEDIGCDPGALEAFGGGIALREAEDATGYALFFEGAGARFEFCLTPDDGIAVRVTSAPGEDGAARAYQQKRWPGGALAEARLVVSQAAGLIAEYVAEVRIKGQASMEPLLLPAAEPQPPALPAPVLDGDAGFAVAS